MNVAWLLMAFIDATNLLKGDSYGLMANVAIKSCIQKKSFWSLFVCFIKVKLTVRFLFFCIFMKKKLKKKKLKIKKAKNSRCLKC